MPSLWFYWKFKMWFENLDRLLLFKYIKAVFCTYYLDIKLLARANMVNEGLALKALKFWLSSALTYSPHMVLTQTHHPWVSKNATHPKERELDLSMCSAHWSLSDVWAGPVAVHHGVSGCGLRHNVPCLGSWWCDGKLFPLLLIFDEESVITSLWLKLILSPKPRLSLIVFLCYLSIGMDACELNDSSFPRLFEVINHMFLFSVAPLHNPCLHTGIYPQSPLVILHIFPV